jgi:hypothetical protein
MPEEVIVTNEELECAFRETNMVELNVLRVGPRWAAIGTLTYVGNRQSFISEDQPSISAAVDDVMTQAREWKHASMS